MAARAGSDRLTAELQGFRAISEKDCSCSLGRLCTVDLADAGSDGSGDDHRQRNGIPGRHLDVQPGWQRGSGAGARNCRSPDATGWGWPSSRRAVAHRRPTRSRRCRTGIRARHVNFSSTWTVNRFRRSSAPAISPGTVRHSIAEFQDSCRTASTRRRADRAASRSTPSRRSGSNTVLGSVPLQLPRQQLQRSGSGPRASSCRSRTSNTARRVGAPHSTSCTTSGTSNTSGRRRRASGTRPTPPSTSS